MKKTAAKWLVAAACLILIGLLLFGYALAKSNWDFSALGTEKMKTEEIVIDDFFHSLSIRSNTENIEVLSAEDGKCRVVFYEPEKYQCSAAVLDKMLDIEVKEPQNWLERFTLFNFSSPKITLYLPKSEYSMFAVKERTGDISIPENFTFERMQISTGTGDVSCSASAKEWMQIKTTTGDIRLEGLSAGKIELSATTGKVELRNVRCEQDLSVSVGTGKTKVTNVFCGSFSSEGSTGDISLEQVFIMTGSMRIRRSTGDVTLSAVQAKEIVIETTTGDVTAALSSQMIVSASSKTGHIEVPKTNAGNWHCSITTTTGDIIVSDLPR